MACTSITALATVCGPEAIAAGVEKIYMLAHTDLNGAETYASNGMVSAIPLDSGKHFVEIGTTPQSAGLKQDLSKDISKGTGGYTQTMSVYLPDYTTDNQTFINEVINQPVAILIKLMTGKYLVAGLNGQMRLTGDASDTGVAISDGSGSTLTFTGFASRRAPLVDTSIISSLIA